MNLMMLRRRAMMMQQGAPKGYTLYDWVQADESTGMPVIPTGYVLNIPRNTTQKRYTVETSFARSGSIPTSNYNVRVIIGNSTDTYDQTICLMRYGNTAKTLMFRYQCYRGGSAGVVSGVAINIGEWHDVVLTYRDDDTIGGKLILDGVSYLITTSTGHETHKQLYMLGTTSASNFVYPCRLARTRIYDYGVLVADLIPAMRDADGVVGFYDVVRKIFCAPSVDGVQLLCGYGLDNFN